MRLSSRLWLLVLGCLLPVVAAQAYMQLSLYERRQAQLGDVALWQAELMNGDLASIVSAAMQLSTIIADFPEVQAAGPGCSDRLAITRRNLPAYRFLAIADPTGRLLCASTPALPAGQAPPWAVSLLAPAATVVGNYATASGVDGAFLPIMVRLPRDNLTMIVALDLRWLSQRLQAVKLEHTPLLTNTTFVLTDHRGTVIARFPDGEQWTGHPVPNVLMPLTNRPRSGVAIVTGPDGRPLLAAYIPDTVPPAGLSAIETLPLSDLMAETERAIWRDMTVVAGAALAALALAWLVGRRFIYRPTEALITAAERWGRGDLQARANAGGSGSEFAILARAFNAMASSLQTRAHEQRLQAELLEAQVAERTRELSQNNNRLQVEIAEREKTEAALHQAQKLQAVGQLAGGIAHDFNNMLATILGSLELMERRVAQSTQHWSEADADRLRILIERATGAVQRGAQLTSGLLAFSRRQRSAARPTDVNRLIVELVTLATSTLGRRIRLVTDLAETPWPALVDPSQVEAAILNLCLNARDAMAEGGTLTIRTTHTAVIVPDGPNDPPPGPYVCVTITDTGVGMTPEVQRRAFDPFFTTKGAAGSGLGLSQVLGMVRRAGGAVRLRSAPGEGTEVTLLLPRAAAEASSTQDTRATENGRNRLPAMVVLVVDDDHAVRQVTVEMLRDLGCEVLQAQGGAEALSLLANLGSTPSLILVDYAMPGMTGLHLARRLRERGLTVPIAMVTGYAELADAEDGESPLDGLLLKPFTIQELQALMTRLQDRPRQRSNVVRLRAPQHR